jgi:hypothetical protein
LYPHTKNNKKYNKKQNQQKAAVNIAASITIALAPESTAVEDVLVLLYQLATAASLLVSTAVWVAVFSLSWLYCWAVCSLLFRRPNTIRTQEPTFLPSQVMLLALANSVARVCVGTFSEAAKFKNKDGFPASLDEMAAMSMEFGVNRPVDGCLLLAACSWVLFFFFW